MPKEAVSPHYDDLEVERAVSRRQVYTASNHDTPNSSGNEDDLRTYLREIGQFKLLSKEEEVELSRTRKLGLAALAITSSDPDEQATGIDGLVEYMDLLKLPDNPTGIDTIDFECLVSDGKIAKERFIQSNLRLVVSIAKRYKIQKMPTLDLIQEGNLGLIRGVEKFDESKGFKFSTYASWWIRQAITRAIADKSRTIRIPVHLSDKMAQFRNIQERLTVQLDRQPTEEEIAQEMDLSAGAVRDIMNYVRVEPSSLDAPVNDTSGKELTWGDYVKDDNDNAPDELVAVMVDQLTLYKIMDNVLTAREKKVLARRFGLITGQKETLEEVGKEFDLTRERIRQIEAKALAKLRHPSVASSLPR